MTRQRRGFGRIERRSSGRYRAAYIGPDLILYRAPETFRSKEDAEGWVATAKRQIDLGTWTSPTAAPAKSKRALTFGDYAETFLAQRTLKPRSREGYRAALRNHLLPTFGEMPVTAITTYDVKTWHASYGDRIPTMRAHAYGLLRMVLGEAVHDGLRPDNPCHIRGAGNSTRVHKIQPATIPELQVIADAMPERYRLMVLLAAWCGLRFGELTKLRRDDVDVKNGELHVRRGVTYVGGEFVVGTPKSGKGTRNVTIPPHIMPDVKEHLAANISGGRNGLLFPSDDGVGHLGNPRLRRMFIKARAAAGRDDLRFHDLRHTGAVMAAQSGATLADLMGRLGHSTVGAAMRYQHASQDGDRAIAEKLSAMAAIIPG